MLDLQQFLQISLICIFILGFWKVIPPSILAKASSGRFNTQSSAVRHTLKSRFVALVYSTFASALCIYTLCTDEAINQDPLRGYSRLSENNLAFAVGFLFADLCFMVEDEKHDYPMLIHHAVSIWGMLVSMASESVCYFVLVRLLAEISTIPLCLRTLCKILDIGTERMRFVNGLLLITVFPLCRFAPLPFYYSLLSAQIGKESYTQLDNLVFVTWIGVVAVLDCLNFYWFKRMVQATVAVFTQKDKIKNNFT